ncbi:MAG: DUF2953 domain-containing protein [Limnochordales bacterium]|nr:DUF2953 domain-containing protein [Limnochordales bacterium]
MEVEPLIPAFLTTMLVALGLTAAILFMLLFLLLLLLLLFPFRFGLRVCGSTESQRISWQLRLRLPFAGYLSYGRSYRIGDLLSGLGRDLQPAPASAALTPSPSSSPAAIPHRAHPLRRRAGEVLRRLARRARGWAGTQVTKPPGLAFGLQTAAKGWEIARLVLGSFDRLHLRIRFGTGDAASTGLLYGTVWAVLGQLPINWKASGPRRSLFPLFRHGKRDQPADLAVELIPDFSARGGILVLSCIGKVRPGQIILALAQYWAKARRIGRGQHRRHSCRAGSRAVGYRGETSHG